MKTNLLTLLVSVLLLNLVPASSQDCDSVTTATGIVPFVVEGNPTACDFGNMPGLKIDGYLEGTFYIQDDSVATYYHCNDDVSLSLNGSWIKVIKTGYQNHQSFSFETSSDINIEKVIVKGGSLNNLKSADLNSAANIYDYNGLKVSSDTGLHAATKSDCKYYDISHIDFIISQSIEIEHTASYSCDMEKVWSINEAAVQDTIFTIPGGVYNTTFITTLHHEETVQKNGSVKGVITIHNTLQETFMIDSIIPLIDGSMRNLYYSKSIPCSLEPGESILCNYQVELIGDIPEYASFMLYGNVPFSTDQARASISKNENSDISYDTVSVIRNGAVLGIANTDKSWESTEMQTYMSANPSEYLSSTALIQETGASDSDSIFIMIQEPDIQVLSNTTYEKSHHWSIKKGVDKDTLNMITGEYDEVIYSISVSKDSFDMAYLTEGLITITNPLKETVLSGILQAEVSGSAATITGTDYKGNISILPGQEKTFSFLLRFSKDVNTPIMVVSLLTGNISFENEFELELPQNTMIVSELNDVISVSDTYDNMAWTDIDSDSTWSYTRYITENMVAGTKDANGIKAFDIENTATIIETGAFDNADVHVNFYYPVIEQSFTTQFNRDSQWDITITTDPEVNQFPSDQTEVTYTIDAEKTFADSNFEINGAVSITNPSPNEPMTFTVADLFNGEEVTFNEIAPDEAITLQPGETIDLTYTYTTDEKPVDQQNSVIIEINDQQFSDVIESTLSDDNADINETNSSVLVSDEFGPISDEPITESSTSSITRTFDTPALNESDYVDGKQSNSVTNTFTVSDQTETISVVTTVNYYIPTLTKTITTEMIQAHDWDIEKTSSVTELNLLAGQDSMIDYTISVEKTGSETYYALKGEVNITNTNPDDYLFITVMEQVNGNQIMLEGANLYGYATIEPGTNKMFKYLVKFAEKPEDGMAITFMANAYTDQIQSAPFSFNDVDGITSVEHDTVTVTDTYGNKVWSDIDTSCIFKYSRPVYSSSLIQSDFINGVYSYTIPNTAKIIEMDKSASVNVNVNCYAPVFSQITSGTYDRTYSWIINKTSDSTNYVVKDGDMIDIPFEVMADANFADANMKLSGEIQIYNPHPDQNMTVELTDIFDGKSVEISDATVIVAPNSVKKVSFASSLDQQTNAYNIATVILNDIDFTSIQHVSFGEPETIYNGNIILDDNMLDMPLGNVSYLDALPVYYNYKVSLGPDFTDSLLHVSNVVTALLSNDTVYSTTKCDVVIKVVSDDSNNEEPEPEPNGHGCTLTPGYWKTHSIYSNKYDIKWRNLPDMDGDGTEAHEDELFFNSGATYLEVISMPSVSSCYIILGRAFGAANLNILAGSDPTDVASEHVQAKELLGAFSLESAEEERALFISVADKLDKYNNGIIGPGHCIDTDRNSSTTVEQDYTQVIHSTVNTYPNPSDEDVYFNIDILESARIRLEIYDSLGNLVTVLFDAYIETDELRNIDIPFYKEPATLYFYRLLINGEVYNGSLLP